jgi:predicted CoA-binding protein
MSAKEIVDPATLTEVPAPLKIVDIFRASRPPCQPSWKKLSPRGAKVAWMQLGVIHEQPAARARGGSRSGDGPSR